MRPGALGRPLKPAVIPAAFKCLEASMQLPAGEQEKLLMFTAAQCRRGALATEGQPLWPGRRSEVGVKSFRQA